MAGWTNHPNGALGPHPTLRRRFHVKATLASQNPFLASQWHPIKNYPLTPHDVAPKANIRPWWKCPDCGHEWEAYLHVRNKKSGTGKCPKCNLLRPRPGKSLAEVPLLVAEWHPQKNGQIKPHLVAQKSHYKPWWLCSVCGYEYQARAAHRSDGSGCPACAGRVVTPTTSLAYLYPEIAKQWHPTKNGDLRPEGVTSQSHVTVWWLDEVCGHEWDCSPKVRTSQGQECPYCDGKRVDNTNSLATTHPEIAKQWHPTKNGERNPHNTTAGSSFVAWWLCPDPECGHEWQTTVAVRTRAPAVAQSGRKKGKIIKAAGCPSCYLLRAGSWDCSDGVFTLDVPGVDF